jgi:hypothetical protein
MIFGDQTIRFTHLEKSGASDELGNFDLVPVNHDATNCRHRPMTFAETAELEFDIATEYWRSTIPVHIYDDTLRAAVMDAKANDKITVNGVKYQIIGGPRTHPDAAGNPFKTTIISKKATG